jgi:hypothetical protein
VSDGIFFDTRALVALAVDLGKAPGRMTQAVTSAAEESGNQLRDQWRSNIQASSPEGHLKWLPDAVTSEMKFGLGTIGVEVGPDTSKKQGALGKGDEYGSVNTPAHMSGHKAADVATPGFERSLDAAMAFGLGALDG